MEELIFGILRYCSLSSRSDQFLPTFRSLYVALVRSHLEYASEIWSPKSVTLIKLIEGVQRRATRLLLPNLTYNERLQQLNLLPLVYQREVKGITTFYKLKCGYYNYSVERYFDFCSDKRLRSYSSNKLKINQVRTVRNYSKALFSIDHHIYGTTSLINSGPLI